MGTLAEALSPARIETSGKFTAMLAYILGQHGWTEPEIVDMKVTSDDVLLVGDEDDPLLDQIAGSGSDLFRNLRGVAEVAGLTRAQTMDLIRLAEARTRIFPWQRPCPECGGPADTGAGHDCEVV